MLVVEQNFSNTLRTPNMNADILNTGNDTTILAERNKVLRNTYGLLSLSLIPTIFGAWLGSALNFSPIIEGHRFVSFMLFMAVAFGFFYAIEKTKNSGWGIAILLAFTLFMGLMMTLHAPCGFQTVHS
jgi:modulator of FtsH protease